MKNRYALTILTGLTIVGIYLVSNGYRQTDSLAQGVTTRLEAELITLRAFGFEPAELIRRKGPFVLVVDDRSGKDSSSLRLQSDRGQHLRDVNTSRRKAEWHEVVELPPGDYVLSDGGEPERRCRITILP